MPSGKAMRDVNPNPTSVGPVQIKGNHVANVVGTYQRPQVASQFSVTQLNSKRRSKLFVKKIERSNKNIMSLIDLYRNRPALWDWKLKEYKDCNKIHDAFVKIAISFGVAEENVEKWPKIFICQVKNKRDNIKTGIGS